MHEVVSRVYKQCRETVKAVRAFYCGAEDCGFDGD